VKNIELRDAERRPAILVIEDVEETRRGIERLLAASGYQVSTAGDEGEAVEKAVLHPPDLILVSLQLEETQILPFACRVRENSGLSEQVPVVVFCVASLDEGEEMEAGHNAHMVRLDNFDQLRAMLSRLLRKLRRVG
jgi:CheY-like chemotaxis protein